MLASGSTALPGNAAAIAASTFDRPEGTPPQRAESSLVTNAATQSEEDASSAVVAAPVRRRPPIALIGGAAAAVVVAIVAIIALRGGGDDAKGKSTHVSVSEPTKSPEGHELPANVDPAGDPAGAGSQMQIDTGRATASAGSVAGSQAIVNAPSTEPTEVVPPVGEGSAAPTAAVAPPAVPTAPVAPKRTTPTLGGKKVVLEYDNAAPKETPKKAPTPVKGDDNASIGAARITYFSGNRKLFSGDADGAIKLYRQALAMYPGYVASYRGLGLAYAQKGDKPNALKALRTYINAVPGAKDVALVKKRIATLQQR